MRRVPNGEQYTRKHEEVFYQWLSNGRMQRDELEQLGDWLGQCGLTAEPIEEKRSLDD